MVLCHCEAFDSICKANKKYVYLGETTRSQERGKRTRQDPAGLYFCQTSHQYPKLLSYICPRNLNRLVNEHNERELLPRRPDRRRGTEKPCRTWRQPADAAQTPFDVEALPGEVPGPGGQGAAGGRLLLAGHLHRGERICRDHRHHRRHPAGHGHRKCPPTASCSRPSPCKSTNRI